jgi:hypothetical protein
VLRLCERHRLHSAALYVLTRINDNRKPLVDLLGALAAAAAARDAAGVRAVALKLLVWMRLAFRGLSYPPNSGLLPWWARFVRIAFSWGLGTGTPSQFILHT